jgi:hypothetical protein
MAKRSGNSESSKRRSMTVIELERAPHYSAVDGGRFSRRTGSARGDLASPVGESLFCFDAGAGRTASGAIVQAVAHTTLQALVHSWQSAQTPMIS